MLLFSSFCEKNKVLQHAKLLSVLLGYMDRNNRISREVERSSEEVWKEARFNTS